MILKEKETASKSDLLQRNEDSCLNEEPTQIDDEFDTTDEEDDEDETMLDDPPMPVFDMKSYVTGPFEEITDEFVE